METMHALSSQLITRTGEEDEKGKRTYNDPTAKVKLNIHFCLVGSCNRTHILIGNTNVAKSVMMLKTV